jgi:hypothetical protein
MSPIRPPAKNARLHLKTICVKVAEKFSLQSSGSVFISLIFEVTSFIINVVKPIKTKRMRKIEVNLKFDLKIVMIDITIFFLQKL